MEETFNLQQFIAIVKRRFFLIISFVIICTGIAIGVSVYVLTPIYQAQTQILVNQSGDGIETYSWDRTETDLRLINTYNVIIKSPAILNKVIEQLNLDSTPELLTEQIDVSSENQSKVVNIIVEDPDPSQAANISNTVAKVFQVEIPQLMAVDNIKILSEAIVSENPSPIKPNKVLNILIAVVMGVAIGIGVALLLEVVDSTIKTERDVEDILQLPVMGLVGLIPLEKGRKARGVQHVWAEKETH